MRSFVLTLVLAACAAAPRPAADDAAPPPTPLPLAIMDFHSVDDPRALYHGGLGPPFPFTNSRVMQPDMDSVLARWIARDGCPRTPAVATTLRGAAGGPDSGQTATELVYGPCREGTEIVHWRLAGVGHAWQGGEQGHLEGMFVGRPTHILDANAEMWRFFSRFSR